MSAWQAEVPATTESSSSVHGQISTKLPGTEFAEEYLCPLDQLGLQGDDATYPETDIPPRGGASLAAVRLGLVQLTLFSQDDFSLELMAYSVNAVW